MENLDLTVKTTETDIISEIAAAVNAENRDEVDKLASKFSDILALGAYMYGAWRQIYGELSGGKYHVLTAADTDKIKIENEKERVYVEMPVQPDIDSFIGEAAPRKLRGEPYLETAEGRFVKGYFTRLKTPIIEKPLDYIETYPYDFVEELKKSRYLGILKKEDIYGFHGCYSLIGDAEEIQPGISIQTTTHDAWSYQPNVDVIELMKTHSAPIKRMQPRELLVMPESRYLDFGKVPQTVIDGVSRKFLDEGFSKETSPMMDIRKLMLTDYRGMTYSPHSSKETLYDLVGYPTALAKEIATLIFFGYNLKKEDGELPDTREELADVLREKYGVVYDKEAYGTDHDYKSKSKFHRILVYAPINYLGRTFLWKRDVRNHFNPGNDTVSTFSDVKITYMFHNIYAVTALDIWYT